MFNKINSASLSLAARLVVLIALVALGAKSLMAPRTIAVPVEQGEAQGIATPSNGPVHAEIAHAHALAMSQSLAAGESSTDIGGELVQPGGITTSGVTLPLGSVTSRIVNLSPGFALESNADTRTSDGLAVWAGYTARNTSGEAARFSADLIYATSP